MPQVVDEKPWYRSKTNIMHVGSLVIFGLESQFHLLQPFIGPQVFAYWILVLNVLGVVLRSMTHAPVTLRDESRG